MELSGREVFDSIIDMLCDRLSELGTEVTHMKVKLIGCEEKGADCMLCPEKHYDTETYNEMEDLEENIETNRIKRHEIIDMCRKITDMFEEFDDSDSDEDDIDSYETPDEDE